MGSCQLTVNTFPFVTFSEARGVYVSAKCLRAMGPWGF